MIVEAMHRASLSADILELLPKESSFDFVVSYLMSDAYYEACRLLDDVGQPMVVRRLIAKRIISQAGKQDGLYWPSAQGEEASPLGEFIAHATRQGYRVGAGRTPYRGYYFKILTKQGPAAEGGKIDYVFQGRMIGGFALVAYPAEYRNSGVMTFIVNHAGIVFQKDLGPGTAKLAERMTSFNPDRTWQKTPSADLEQ